MILYLFKIGSIWIFGKNDECEYPAGNLSVEPNREAGTISIYYLDGKPKHENIHFSEFRDKDGKPYASFADLKAAYQGFFFRVSELAGESGLLFPNPATGFKARVIIRDNKFCFDTELTATGFSGVVSADEGVTGDWVNKVEFPLY